MQFKLFEELLFYFTSTDRMHKLALVETWIVSLRHWLFTAAIADMLTVFRFDHFHEATAKMAKKNHKYLYCMSFVICCANGINTFGENRTMTFSYGARKRIMTRIQRYSFRKHLEFIGIFVVVEWIILHINNRKYFACVNCECSVRWFDMYNKSVIFMGFANVWKMIFRYVYCSYIWNAFKACGTTIAALHNKSIKP